MVGNNWQILPSNVRFDPLSTTLLFIERNNHWINGERNVRDHTSNVYHGCKPPYHMLLVPLQRITKDNHRKIPAFSFSILQNHGEWRTFAQVKRKQSLTKLLIAIPVFLIPIEFSKLCSNVIVALQLPGKQMAKWIYKNSTS